jgi:hypothetical protein
MQNLLEPKFIDLVNCDEQKLIVFWAVAQWLLELQQFVYLQVGDVGDVFFVGH